LATRQQRHGAGDAPDEQTRLQDADARDATCTQAARSETCDLITHQQQLLTDPQFTSPERLHLAAKLERAARRSKTSGWVCRWGVAGTHLGGQIYHPAGWMAGSIGFVKVWAYPTRCIVGNPQAEADLQKMLPAVRQVLAFDVARDWLLERYFSANQYRLYREAMALGARGLEAKNDAVCNACDAVIQAMITCAEDMPDLVYVNRDEVKATLDACDTVDSYERDRWVSVSTQEALTHYELDRVSRRLAGLPEDA